LIASPHITGIGNIMYTTFSPWLIIIGLILLLAMVGCICITLKSPEGRTSRSISSSPLESGIEMGVNKEITAGVGGLSGVKTNGSFVRVQRRLYSTTNNIASLQ